MPHRSRFVFATGLETCFRHEWMRILEIPRRRTHVIYLIAQQNGVQRFGRILVFQKTYTHEKGVATIYSESNTSLLGTSITAVLITIRLNDDMGWQ